MLDIEFCDQRVKFARLDKLKGGAGDKLLLCFVTPLIKQAFRHYSKSFNKYWGCQTTDLTKPQHCCTLVESIREQRFLALVWSYAVNQEGDISDPNKCQGSLRAWNFTEGMYEDLSGLAKGLPILDKGFEKPQHDFAITVQKKNFAQYSILPHSKCHLKTNRAWYDYLQKEVVRLTPLLGDVVKYYNASQLKEMLGLGAVPFVQRQAHDIQFESIIETVALVPKVEVPAKPEKVYPGPATTPDTGDAFADLEAAVAANAGTAGPTRDWTDEEREKENPDLSDLIKGAESKERESDRIRAEMIASTESVKTLPDSKNFKPAYSFGSEVNLD